MTKLDFAHLDHDLAQARFSSAKNPVIIVNLEGVLPV
jgi:hypothetical protein